MLQEVRQRVLPLMQQHRPIVAWIVDDNGTGEERPHSAGVARHSCGQLDRQDNCQVAVSLSPRSGKASVPIGWRLSLHEEWAQDRERRRWAGGSAGD